MPFHPRRELGRTGFRATALGAGDLADASLGVPACARILARALEAGINVVDTAPAYEDGLSERIVGRALADPRTRAGVFVIDKVDHFDQPVPAQIDGSIERLGFPPDAFVFHNVSRMDDWQTLAAAGGGMDALADAVRRGRCRFRGISSHRPEVARAAIASGKCDVIMFPLGPFVDARYVDDVLPFARERGVGTVCFKTFGAGKLVATTEGYGRPVAPENVATLAPALSVDECVHATLTMDPDVTLLGLSSPEEQDAAFAAAARFERLTPAALDDVRRRAAEAVRGKGKIWWDPDA